MNKDEKSSNAGKWALGALAAGVVGYLAGILTAPKSGKETREDIKVAASKAGREAEKRLKELYNELSELVDEGSVKAHELKARAKLELEDAIAKAKVSRDKIKELLSAVRAGDAEDPDLQAAIQDAEKLKKHLKQYLKRSDEA